MPIKRTVVQTSPIPKQFGLAETVFNVKEAADYLRISKPFIFNIIKRGDLKTFKIGTRTMIHGTALATYVTKQMAGRPTKLSNAT